MKLLKKLNEDICGSWEVKVKLLKKLNEGHDCWWNGLTDNKRAMKTNMGNKGYADWWNGLADSQKFEKASNCMLNRP